MPGATSGLEGCGSRLDYSNISHWDISLGDAALGSVFHGGVGKSDLASGRGFRFYYYSNIFSNSYYYDLS